MSNGVVTAVNVLSPGIGYTSAPVVIIAPPFTPAPVLAITAMSRLTFGGLSIGTNYQLESISGGVLTVYWPPFTASSSSYTQLVFGTASPYSYRVTPTPAPTQAQATAQVVNGFVVNATLVNGGSGYTTNPAVAFSGGGGSNAAAVATVSEGIVTALTITNPGFGYTNTPTIIIAPPPSASLWTESIVQVMKIDLTDLSPYDPYQLQAAPRLGEAWTSLDAPFVPTSMICTRYIDVTANVGFFRAKYGE